MLLTNSSKSLKYNKNWITVDVTRENSQLFATLPQVSLQNEHRNSIMMTCHHPDLGSDSNNYCFKQTSYTAQPIRSATQIRKVISHQYGISAFHPNTAFCRETSGNIAKFQLSSCMRPPLQ